MRNVQVWIIAHPEKERIFTQPNPVSELRKAALRAEGYEIYTTMVCLPIEDTSATVPNLSVSTSK